MEIKTKEEVIARFNSFMDRKPNAVYCRIHWNDRPEDETEDDFIALFPTLGKDCDDDVVYSCEGGINEFITLMDGGINEFITLMDGNKSCDFKVVGVYGFSYIGD